MLKIEELGKSHNRKNFDCGEPALNQYLRNIARQHITKGISRTFVIVDSEKPEEIRGFLTLAFCEVISKDLPAEYAKKYPARVPGAKLARLAVSKKYKYQGLGKFMMVNAMERTLLTSRHIGITGFFVDAKDREAKNYYEQFGFIAFPDASDHLFMPLVSLKSLLGKT